MANLYLLGIDIGTSSTKAVLLTQKGTYVDHAAQNYSIETPHPGWAEQQPETWWDAVVSCTQQVVSNSGINPASIASIGLSGQMHGTVCVDHTGHVLRPAIIWADQRTVHEVVRVVDEIGITNLAAWTGNPLATGFMLASWLWLQHHETETLRRLRYLLLPKDYVRFRMTGVIGSEPSDAASTSLFHPGHRTWSQPLLDALALDAAVLPPVHASVDVAEGLLPLVAERMGLLPGTPVIYGGSDQAMQALGNGVIEPGLLSSTIGTGGQLFASTSHYIVDPELRMQSYCHVVPGRWHVETAILSAGLSLKWLRDAFFSGTSFQVMADHASSVKPGADGVFFLPYLLGERTPHMDPYARGALVGVTHDHTRAHIIRAVMEGVVFALNQGFELMTDLGITVDRVVASGGATAHPLWLQLQADIYNRPVYRTMTVEAAACGAALLAGVGVGIFNDAQEAVRTAVNWHPVPVEPQPQVVQIYQESYQLFCALYPALTSFNKIFVLDALVQ